MKRIDALSILIILAALIFTCTSVHGAQKKITFCVYASDKPSVMHMKFTPIVSYLQEKLNADGYESLIGIKIHQLESKFILHTTAPSMLWSWENATFPGSDLQAIL